MTTAPDVAATVQPPLRRVLLVTHTGREEATRVAAAFSKGIADAGVTVRMLQHEADDMQRFGACTADVVAPDAAAAAGCDLVIVFGGDGTILRGAELARPTGTPLLGVNLGHVGFLAEADVDDLDVTVDRVVQGRYDVEERMTIDVAVRVDGRDVAREWALNEASVEKAARERMIEVVAEIDQRPLSRWGCDGVVCATPTGSTAYSFSAGGPIVWPGVEALLLVPISAHALFARPMVVSPDAVLAIEVLLEGSGTGVLWCDGRRTVDLPPGARIEVSRGRLPVRLARLHKAPFTDRLVRKFGLPVSGWRGHHEVRHREGDHRR
ncbi:MAG: NAD kinase [Nocardioidaceae bacterium]